MKTIIFSILLITFFTTHLSAGNLLRHEDSGKVLPYVALDKLNEKLYSSMNRDAILGIGIDIKADRDTSFVIAFEGDIYNDKKNKLLIAPTQKIGLYLNGGTLTYKFKCKF